MDSKLLLEDVFDALSESVVLIDSLEQRIKWANKSFLDNFRQSKDVFGKDFSALIRNLLVLADDRDPLETSIHTGQKCRAEFFRVTSTEISGAIDVTTTPIKDQDGKVHEILWMSRDISDQIKIDEKINYLAFHDPLTGLYNRNIFCDRLHNSIIQAKREKQKVVLIYLDLDNFKNMNDSLGHYAGDLLLKSVSKRLKTSIRENDTISRIGGDEFTILFSCKEIDEIKVVVEKINNCFIRPFTVEENIIKQSASIGIAIYPDDADSDCDLLRHADIAMYAAKIDKQSNCLYFFSEELHKLAEQRRGLVANLRPYVQSEIDS